MDKVGTGLKDCYIIVPDKFGDERGYYSPFFVDKEGATSIKGVVQGARSKSSKGVLRGMHFQEVPYDQAKLVECLSGAVLDVAYDLRKDSPTYKKYVAVELTPENGRQLFIPKGFAHGFVALKDNTLFQYLVDSDYRPELENGFSVFDIPELVEEIKEYGVEPIVSEKDKARGHVDDLETNFYTHYRYLVTGVKGQLGYEIVKELNNRGIYDIIAVDSDTMDLTNEREVSKIIEDYKPDVIFNCAAYTAVDKAEVDSTLAYDVNVKGTKYLINSARKVGSKVIQISSDYVFDGTKEGLYTTEDKVNPLNVYGKTKALCEDITLNYDKSFVVRTCGVFGINGKNFVRTMRELAKTHRELRVVNDQIMSPTSAKDLACLLVDMSNTEKYGLYHATNTGFCSWAEFAAYAIKDLDCEIIPVTTEEYYAPQYRQAKHDGIELHIAERPRNERLDKTSLVENGFYELSHWHRAVDNYIEELEAEKAKENEKAKVKIMEMK